MIDWRNPNCRQGKHAACPGTAWHGYPDELGPCDCVCHDEGNP